MESEIRLGEGSLIVETWEKNYTQNKWETGYHTSKSCPKLQHLNIN